MSERQILRKKLRAKRNALSSLQQKQAANDLSTHILQAGILNGATSIALYLANDGEIATEGIISTCWQSNIRTTLPVLHPFCAGRLLFLQYHQTTTMVCNKYGIPEPTLAVTAVVPKTQLDIIFVPLTGYDARGNRIGMGGGYYDRTLASLNRTQTKIIGLAHHCQQVDLIPTDNWDIPLDMIVSDKTVLLT